MSSGVPANIVPPLRQLRAFVASFLDRAPIGLVATAGLMLLGGVLEGIGLFLLVPLLGLLVPGDGQWRIAAAQVFAMVGATTPLARMAMLLIAFVAVMIARAAVLLLRDRRLATLTAAFVERERVDLIRALAAARWEDVAGLRHARLTAAIGIDVQRVAAASHYLIQAAVAAVMLAAQWLLTLVLAPVLAALALVLFVVAALALSPTLRRIGGIGSAALQNQARLMEASGQFLAGLKTAVAQNAQGAFVRDFEEGARALSEQSVAFERRQSRSRVATATVTAVAGACVLLVGTWAAVPVAALLVAIVAMARMSGPAGQLQQAAQQLAHLLPAHAGIAALTREMGRHRIPVDSDGPVPAGVVTFRGVSYRHPDGGGVSDLDLTIRPGEIVGVVGPSGAGKTTFVDLLVGLLQPHSGQVTVGDVVLGPDNAARYRRGVAYVGQDGFLIHDTIRRNLSLGVGPVDDAALWAALERVGAAALVRGMAAGLDTIVAERGARLSGGERQRIALARALLRAPSLLILDEATNAIDVAGERAILADIAADGDRPAIVIVAHRAETLAPCERLLEFAAGRLVADAPVAK